MIQEIRCSQLARPMNCLGFLSMENLIEEEAGQPAKEGTACGEILTAMIKQRTEKPQIGHTASNGVIFDNDMWFYTTEMYRDLLASAQGAEITSEERIDWVTQAGIRIRGQYDASFLVGTTLYVPDLKYGYKIVEAKKNWQLIGYAIGRIKQIHSMYGFVPSHIHFQIHQPRAYHPDGKIRSWVIEYQELLLLWQEIEQRMMEYVQGVKILQSGSHCRYCPAASSCPVFNKAFYNTIDETLGDWKEGAMSNEDVSRKLDLITRAEEVLKIKKDSLKTLATMRINQGQIIPGWSFEEDYGDRAWVEGVTAKSIKDLTGVDITKTDMLSPNQAEKAGVPRKLVAQLVKKAFKGTKLVKKDLTAQADKVFKNGGTK